MKDLEKTDRFFPSIALKDQINLKSHGSLLLNNSMNLYTKRAYYLNLINSFCPREFNSTRIGNRPCNSGIRSLGVTL